MEFIINPNSFNVSADSREEAIEKAIRIITKDISFLFPIEAIEND